jgi:hypothetical protein
MRPAKPAKIGLLAQEDPPPPQGRNGSRTAALLALIPELRGRRGQWFRIAEFSAVSSASVSAKRLKERYPNQLEVRAVANHAEKTSALYARWVGSRANGEREQ